MPLKSIPSNIAYAHLKQNRFSRWDSKINSLQNSDLACNRLNNEYFLRYSSRTLAPFTVERTDSIYAIGSCFAREIELHFRDIEHIVASAPDPFSDPHTDAHFLNRYNLQSMELEFKRSLEPDFEFDSKSLLFEVKPGLFRDFHYNAIYPPIPLADCLRRRSYLKALFQKIIDSNIIVITLGLNEVWYDKSTGYYLNTWNEDLLNLTPSPDLELRITSVKENVDSLEEIYSIIKKYARKDFKLVITVSPVPMSATFSGDDIVLANTRSKSILRASAEEFCSKHPEVSYFPSYEIAVNSDPKIVFQSDRRHVTKNIAHHIVGTFSSIYSPQKDFTPDKIDFTASGNSKKFTVYGWSTSEEFGTWTEGKTAILAFSLPLECHRTILCEFNLLVFLVPEKHPCCKISVKANGVQIDQWNFDNPYASLHKIKLSIPQELPKDGVLLLTFEIDKPISPKSLGLGNDPRELGFALQSILFE